LYEKCTKSDEYFFDGLKEDVALRFTEELKKELGNAIAAYGQILTKAFLGISTPKFEHLMRCTEDELKHKLQMLKDFHKSL
jgi:hypothetical protein